MNIHPVFIPATEFKRGHVPNFWTGGNQLLYHHHGKSSQGALGPCSAKYIISIICPHFEFEWRWWRHRSKQ